MAPLRWSFISRRVLMVDPPKFQIAAIRKRNGVRVSNFQDFLVSVISTSMLNKKKIHDIGCTPLFELGWNDEIMCGTQIVFKKEVIGWQGVKKSHGGSGRIKICSYYSLIAFNERVIFWLPTRRVTALCVRVCCIVCVCDCVMVMPKRTRK